MSLTKQLLDIANVGAEWVLWVLVALSVLSIAVIIERGLFFFRNRSQAADLQKELSRLLSAGAFEEAAEKMRAINTMEAQVVAIGLEQHALGVASVSELMQGALSAQKQRYERFLVFLATIGSNAPFIGLFGTVLGIIQALPNASGRSEEAQKMLIDAIAEALVATGTGLIVAIPAVIFYNIYKTRIKQAASSTDQLVRTLLAYLSAENPPQIVHTPSEEAET